MTDMELTVLAAKAAGIRFEAGSEQAHPKSGAWWGLWLVYDHEPAETARRYWNPLADDGDALRLAVRLDLTVMTGMARDGEGWASIDTGAEPNASTRRAIVLAAAQIGNAKPADAGGNTHGKDAA